MEDPQAPLGFELWDLTSIWIRSKFPKIALSNIINKLLCFHKLYPSLLKNQFTCVLGNLLWLLTGLDIPVELFHGALWRGSAGKGARPVALSSVPGPHSPNRSSLRPSQTLQRRKCLLGIQMSCARKAVSPGLRSPGTADQEGLPPGSVSSLFRWKPLWCSACE